MRRRQFVGSVAAMFAATGTAGAAMTIDIRSETGPLSASGGIDGVGINIPGTDGLLTTNTQANQLRSSLAALNAAAGPRTLVGLGDSLMESVRLGVTREQSHLYLVGTARGFTNIINKGIGGNRTDQMLARFDDDVLANNPDHLALMLSANDFFRSAADFNVGMPLHETEANMNAMLTKAYDNNIPVTLYSHNWIRDSVYLAQYDARRAMLARLSAHPAVVAFVDPFMDWAYFYIFQQGQPSPNLFDTLYVPEEYNAPHIRQIHPNVAGNQRIANLVLTNPRACALYV